MSSCISLQQCWRISILSFIVFWTVWFSSVINLAPFNLWSDITLMLQACSSCVLHYPATFQETWPYLSTIATVHENQSNYNEIHGISEIRKMPTYVHCVNVHAFQCIRMTCRCPQVFWFSCWYGGISINRKQILFWHHTVLTSRGGIILSKRRWIFENFSNVSSPKNGNEFLRLLP